MRIQKTNATGTEKKLAAKMKVEIMKDNGRSPYFVYEDLDPTMTILGLKMTLQERQGILHIGQNLFFHFIEVDDDMLLHHYAQGQNILRLTMILQKRGKWVPETFFVKKHKGELTSFVIITRQGLEVKAGIFKITQSITRDEKKFCEVYTYNIDSDSLVHFFKRDGKMTKTTNLQHPPKTIVSIGDEEIEPIKKEEFSLRAKTDSLDEKLSFNYELLTTVTDVPFPPNPPASSKRPGATPIWVDPGWVVLNNVVINSDTLGILLSGEAQKRSPQLPIKQRQQSFTFPYKNDLTDDIMNKYEHNIIKIPNDDNKKKSKDGNMKKSVGKTVPERKGIFARGRAMLSKSKKRNVQYGRKLKALFWSQSFTFPEENDSTDDSMEKYEDDIMKNPNDDSKNKSKDDNMEKSSEKIVPERKGIFARGRAMLTKWKKRIVQYRRKLKALFWCRPTELKNRWKDDMIYSKISKA